MKTEIEVEINQPLKEIILNALQNELDGMYLPEDKKELKTLIDEARNSFLINGAKALKVRQCESYFAIIADFMECLTDKHFQRFNPQINIGDKGK